jgi:flavin reductase (DIM6/NTAB) family NADH-FMN oxidoreductase RutF
LDPGHVPDVKRNADSKEERVMKKQVEPFDGITALPSFPVVLVTVDKNIMTAAAFHFYSFEPPCVMVGIKPENYSYEQILEKGEYTINIPRKEQLDLVRICGSISGRDEDKFIKAGVTPIKGLTIDTFFIKECPVNIECVVVHKIDYEGSHRWFIGKIQAVHIDDEFSRDQALMYWLKEYRSVGNILLKK